jgi:hypothetical protein
VWQRRAGYGLLAFAWLYPHFLEPGSLLAYAYAAPMGVVPCPTLALVLGSTLLAQAAVPRWLARVLAGAGIFYGTFGVLRLGVAIDAVLLLGALLVLACSMRQPRDSSREGLTATPA